ncbi:MAG: pilus assembly protein CpaD [Alphaproteobacteria bacterium]|nr:pilus assembly protein CpaD [Alphaproteobacteria bacterium]MDB5722585.1 pilus assembly protein CpaD [Alphaproteobacteria bacterium]
MMASKSLAALLAFGALAAAPAQAGPVNKSLYSVNQPVVQRADYVLDVEARDGLPQPERARLRAWFGSLGLGYGDRVAVDEAYPSPARADVARVAAEFGLLLSDSAPITAGEVQPGLARIIVSRSFASVPGCPHWSGADKNNAMSPGYGCATYSNLAAMIADPTDLVLGQAGSGTSDGKTGAKAIKVYRDTAPSGSKGLSAPSTGGK